MIDGCKISVTHTKENVLTACDNCGSEKKYCAAFDFHSATPEHDCKSEFLLCRDCLLSAANDLDPMVVGYET